jgi:hypothetical protein
VTSIYALLVGIDVYRAPLRQLQGGRNDIRRASAYLHANTAPGTRLLVEELCDGAATRAAVIDAFRNHLGRAGAGDTALFWFSGHGSSTRVPAPLWHLEPTGEMQTLLCVDSRHDGVPDLLDKELAILIQEVAAGGAHVAVVIDSCHAGGANRHPATIVRHAPPLRVAPLPEKLLPELTDGRAAQLASALVPGGHDHVALLACQPFELAQELPYHGEYRGLFSAVLLDCLARLGHTATYRELLTASRCVVENILSQQVPTLYPVSSALADQQFLGGQLQPPAAAIRMRFARGRWEIDAGACHGLPASPGPDALRVAVHHGQPVQEATVVRVLAVHSIVEPVGWRPDPDRQYPVTLTSVPTPSTTVAMDGTPATEAVRQAIAVAAPGRRPSPHVRVVELADPRQVPELIVASCRPGEVQITDADGTALAPPVPDVAAHSGRMVSELEHIARWRQVKALANPVSRLANAVRLEVVTRLPGEFRAPLGRDPMTVDADGVLRLYFARTAKGWDAPTVFVRLRNTTDRRLYCVLLNLTDRFRIHADLLPGAFAGPGRPVAVAEGMPIEFSLPPGRDLRPGTYVRDWLMLLVAEAEFTSAPFCLPRLGEPHRAVRAAAITGLLDRLGKVATHRSSARAAVAHDWTTTLLPVQTIVPPLHQPPR